MTLRATEVFVPSDFPTITYVERGDEKLERRMRDALETPKSPISVSGPSKTGKTALVRKIVGDDNLIHIFGPQIEAPSDLWDAILNWMDVPSSFTEARGSSETLNPNASASATIKFPGLGSASVGGGVSTATAANINTTATRTNRGLPAVQREVANSPYVVFLDDFHYIHRDLQENVGQLIKTAAELSVRFCIASVPHRSDDVVRSNHELRGRTINVDTRFWSEDDLVRIGQKGFSALNIKIDEEVISGFARESCTSPQIMQALCLQLCFETGAKESCHETKHFNVSVRQIRDSLEQTATRTDYTSLLKQMHAGPRIRGTERKEFDFNDETRGDAYRAALLALKADPPTMEFNYADLQQRISAVCLDDKPVGSSITESLKQIAIAADKMHPKQKIVEWDPDAASGTFAIIDPYFLFFLRSSDLMTTLGDSSQAAQPTLI